MTRKRSCFVHDIHQMYIDTAFTATTRLYIKIAPSSDDLIDLSYPPLPIDL